MTIQITSPAFQDGETFPQTYTCDGEDVSPPLAWTGLPEGAQSLALIVEDPDAPSGNWVHWVLYDLPGDVTSLVEGSVGVGTAGVNDSRRSGYAGPCPPRGRPHRYFFKLYALRAHLGLRPGATKRELERAMAGLILDQGQLMGSYGRG